MTAPNYDMIEFLIDMNILRFQEQDPGKAWCHSGYACKSPCDTGIVHRVSVSDRLQTVTNPIFSTTPPNQPYPLMP